MPTIGTTTTGLLDQFDEDNNTINANNNNENLKEEENEEKNNKEINKESTLNNDGIITTTNTTNTTISTTTTSTTPNNNTVIVVEEEQQQEIQNDQNQQDIQQEEIQKEEIQKEIQKENEQQEEEEKNKKNEIQEIKEKKEENDLLNKPIYSIEYPQPNEEINLQKYDIPHFCKKEWWYFNCHLTLQKEISIWISFFSSHPYLDYPNYRSNALIWGMVDENLQKYHNFSLIDKNGFENIKEIIAHDKNRNELHFKALKEMVERNSLPLPDHLEKDDVLVLPNSLFIQFGKSHGLIKKISSKNSNSHHGQSHNGQSHNDQSHSHHGHSNNLNDDKNRIEMNNLNNEYIVYGKDEKEGIGFQLKFKPNKKVNRHARNGYVDMGESMIYYFISNMFVDGMIELNNNNEKYKVLSNKSKGWYDHEYTIPFGNDNTTTTTTTINGNEDENNTMTVVDNHDCDNNKCDNNTIEIDTAMDYNNNNNTELKKELKKEEEEQITKKTVLEETLTELSKTGWNWFSIQLTNNIELSIVELFNEESLNCKDITKQKTDCRCIYIDKFGNRLEIENCKLTKEKLWHSMSSTSTFTLNWTIDIPSLDFSINGSDNQSLDKNTTNNTTIVTTNNKFNGGKLTVKSVMIDQEINTIILNQAFYEGKIRVEGILNNEKVNGIGFIEMKRERNESDRKVSNFLKAFGKIVANQLQVELTNFTMVDNTQNKCDNNNCDNTQNNESLKKNIYGEKYLNHHYFKNIKLNTMQELIINPIKIITDRGGKTWRSYALVAAYECINGLNKFKEEWRSLITFPELLHTASLLIDDIEDNSIIRRGDKTSHLIYGLPLTLNCGNFWYFAIQNIIEKTVKNYKLKDQLKVYEIYFHTMRSAHIGQALDIKKGDNYKILENGDQDKILENQIRTCHLLKSGASVSALGRIGVILGNGTKQQEDLFANFFDAIGLAFQIIDDVLNLKGFENNLKTIGEDIKEGKVTYPIVKAIQLLPNKEERVKLWNRISVKPQDQNEILEIIKVLEECGALEESVKDANECVENAWRELDPYIPDSHPKLMLRCFAKHILERFY
ncbi:hypothetical protein ABK040_000892 [Willaertia magna]